MRLSEYEVASIKRRVHEQDPKAEIYLYGSRTDDNKRGGDIDLLVMSACLDLSDKSKIIWSICKDIGEQKLDILIAKHNKESPFVEHIFLGAVKL